MLIFLLYENFLLGSPYVGIVQVVKHTVVHVLLIELDMLYCIRSMARL